MKLCNDPVVHLTYCLNIHPGETWAENLAAIREHALAVRDTIGHGGAFGLGLRLSNTAACELGHGPTREEFRKFLADNGLYAFTINGFPYGRFHEEPVKENVYKPDWRQVERLDYTVRLAEILADLLPEGVPGSISTVPCSYKEWLAEGDLSEAAVNLADCAHHLERLQAEKGADICLGLEPEPDCAVETTGETIAFLEEYLFDDGAKHLNTEYGHDPEEARRMMQRRIGVCFDTCHVAVQFEDVCDSIAQYRKHDVRIAKVQISAALETDTGEQGLKELGRFRDEVYLHQVKVQSAANEVMSHPDLNDETLKNLSGGVTRVVRAHFHVPLYYEGTDVLSSTAADLTPDFFAAAIDAGATQFEVETYTFDVLPDELRALPVTESIAKELRWAMDRISG